MQAGAAKLATSYGVNVAGYLTAESGVGTAARGYIQGLQQAGIQVALNNFDVGVTSRKSDDSAGAFANNNPYPINLICVNADQLPAFIGKFGEDYFKGKYNIGVWWWEFPEFPQEFWQSFRWFDEIWVGSRFIQHSLSSCSPVPIVHIPPVVTLPEAKLVGREALGLPDDEFLFLFMFDFLSAFERKNPLALIRAFRKAFDPKQPVRLILKCINSESAPEKLAEMTNSIGDSRVTLMDHYLSRVETTSLVSACDAYASMHRSEGLGLPLAEAMLLRKPVIATGWSGNVDFMNANNSWLLPYNLVANEQDHGNYRAGEIWTEPDEAAATVALKDVFENRERASFKAAQAAIDASTYFSAETVAAAIQVRLAAVKSFHPDICMRCASSDVTGQLPKQDGAPSSTNLLSSGISGSAPAPYMVDAVVSQQLDMISGASGAPGAAQIAKGVLRRVVMPIVEKAGYLNSIYSRLFRHMFEQLGTLTARIDLIDNRTRRHIAAADARIKALEEQVEHLRKASTDDSTK